LCGADVMGIGSPLLTFFLIHFHWKQTSFSAIFEWNPDCTTKRNHMIPSNTGSIQVWCPDITDMSFEELVRGA
jgi:hypothetical protein